MMRRGDTLWSLLADLQNPDHELTVAGRKVALLAVGTNDLDASSWTGGKSSEEQARGKMEVIKMVVAELERQSPGIYIVLSSVLPRPCDDDLTHLCCKLFNRSLRRYAFANRMGYAPLWSSFVVSVPHRDRAVPRSDLFTGGQLHLNHRGARLLSRRLVQALSRGSLDQMAARALPPVVIAWD